LRRLQNSVTTLAQTLLAGDRAAAARLATGLLKPLPNNFVERPWGGVAIRAHKNLCALPAQVESAGQGLGEVFEISACRSDAEARAHPSRLRLTDGSEIPLDRLLERHGELLLGREFTQRYGACFPLLPKTLDIKELLSVQGHPPGHAEAYVIIDAAPGATIRLGFERDVAAAELAAQLRDGRRLQRQLLAALPQGLDQLRLQRVLAPWLAARARASAELRVDLERLVAPSTLRWSAAEPLAARLRDRYWEVLELMNACEVSAGQILYNATPARLLAPHAAPTAEVHALGNPEGHEILLLEVRRPGPTLRAWDNARFPLREIDIDGTLAALNLRRTEPAEFVVEPCAVPGRPGVFRTVESTHFRLETLRLAPHSTIEVDGEPPHSLHAIDGVAVIERAQGEGLGTLERGESAIVAAGVGAYRLGAGAASAELVKVNLPERG
jgi:mannose-6-phosphate isomerase class I